MSKRAAFVLIAVLVAAVGAGAAFWLAKKSGSANPFFAAKCTEFVASGNRFANYMEKGEYALASDTHKSVLEAFSKIPDPPFSDTKRLFIKDQAKSILADSQSAKESIDNYTLAASLTTDGRQLADLRNGMAEIARLIRQRLAMLEEDIKATP